MIADKSKIKQKSGVQPLFFKFPDNFLVKIH